MRGRIKQSTDLDRVLSNCVIADCWEYQMGLDKDGYGVASTGSKRTNDYRPMKVHRIVYQQLVGPIPDGMQIDHLCRNRKCCNPDHLEPVTPKVNNNRGHNANAVKRECPRSHGPENYVKRTDRNSRRCKVCDNERMANQWKRKAA